MSSSSLTAALRETLALFEGSSAPLSTTEAADRLGLGRRSTYERLERLADLGEIETKLAGGSARVWWRPRPAATEPPGTAADDRPIGHESLADVLDGAEVGVFVLDPSFDVVWVNAATERYFGIDREQVVGRSKRALIEETIAPAIEDADHFSDTVLATYEDNTYTERFQCRVTAGAGREGRWLDHRSEPIESGRYAGGRVEHYYDVTDRHRSERALQETERRYLSLVDAVEEYAIVLLDPDGDVRTWNEGARELTGYPEAAVVGEHVSTFYTEADREAGVPTENLANAAAMGSVEDEGWRVRADGSTFWAHVTVTAVYDDEDDLLGFVKITRDTTERRERERQLRDERDLIGSILDVAPVNIAVVRPDGAIARANEYIERHLGRGGTNAEEYTVGDWDLYVNGANVPIEDRPYMQVFETGEPVSDWECEVEYPTGERRWVSISAAPLHAGDEVDRVVVCAENVTQLREQARRLERQRDELESDLEDVFDRISDGFYGLDRELRFTYVNDRAEELLGVDEAAVLGRDVRDAVPLTDDIEAALLEAIEIGEPVFLEDYSGPLDGWFENAIYPSESGVSVYVRDVSDRKEAEEAREASEERLQLALEAADMGVWELDLQSGESPVRSRRHDRIFGYEPPVENWTVERFFEHVHPTDRDDVRAVFDDAVETGTLSFECRIDRVDGERRWIAASGELNSDADDEPLRAVGVVRDVTERKERERELEEARRWNRTLVENFPAGAVGLVDEEFRYVRFVGTPGGDTDLTRTDYEGAGVRDVLPERVAEVVVPAYEAALGGQASEFEDTLDGRAYQFHFVPVSDDDGEVFAAIGMSQDVTARKGREEDLREAKAQLEAATEAGSVWTFEWHVPDDEMRTDAAMARTFGIDPDDSKEGVSRDRFVEAVHEHDRERVERAVEEAVASCGEFREEYRVWDADDELRWVVARGRVECDDEGDAVTFPGALVDITERKEAELQLELHRQQLEALNNLNEVVREITEAVIERSTREEIERAVCEHLAESDSYRFAWIGDVDARTQTVNHRVEAGVEGYLDDITISVDPDDERSRGPTGRAALEREVQVVQDVQHGSDHGPWRDHVRAHRIESSAAIPIVHEETLYGVLNVYADRPNAFADDERAVIGQLGEVVGHAIAAIERQRALTSEEVIELEFQIADIFGAIGVPIEVDGTIALGRAVPVGDGTFLEYGTATGGAIEAIEAVVASPEAPMWESVTVLGTEGESTHFELAMADPPVLSSVVAIGGYFDVARIEDGDYYMRVHLPPSASVREVVDSIAEAYPGVELVSQRHVERPTGTGTDVRTAFDEVLTDRQRAAIEAGYFAGYFEWPRNAKGEAVAESLGIAPATYHQHLREGQRKLLAVALDDRDWR